MADAGSSSVSLMLALRFLLGQRSNKALSFIATVAVAGLAIAIALLIMVLSVMNGFEHEFRHRILGLAPHATIWLREPVDDWPEWVERIEAHPQVRSVQPSIERKALAVSGLTAYPMLLKGVDQQRFAPLLSDFLVEGSSDSLGADGIALGTALAAQLDLDIGDRLRLLLPDVDDSRSRARPHGVVVQQLFNTGTEIDNRVAIAPLAQVAMLGSAPEQIQAIQLQVDELFAARQIAQSLADQQRELSSVSDWTHSFGNLYTAIQLSRQLVALLLASIIAVAVFNVFITLGIAVRSRQGDIAILRTMGIERRTLLSCFVLQGLVIALLGCLIGSVLGVLLAQLAPTMVEGLQQLLAVEFLRTDVYPISYLPSKIIASDIGIICLAALLMSLLATLYPAIRASQVAPAQALRHL